MQPFRLILSALLFLIFTSAGFENQAEARRHQKSGRGGKASQKGRSKKIKQKSRVRRHVAFCNGKVYQPQTFADRSPVAVQCSGAGGKKQTRTFTCVQWVALQAEKAFSLEPACKDKVTVPLLMCIFKREVGSLSNNPCVKNGCGMSQFTGEGVSYVKSSFGQLGAEYDFFWDLVGRPEGKKNKCSLRRTNALDRDTAVIMAATHLCNEVKVDGLKSPFSLARRYNGNDNYMRKKRVQVRDDYGRDVANCVKTGRWKNDTVSQSRRVGVKSECRSYRSCGGAKLKSKSRAKTHSLHNRGRGGNQ